MSELFEELRAVMAFYGPRENVIRNITIKTKENIFIAGNDAFRKGRGKYKSYTRKTAQHNAKTHVRKSSSAG